MLNAGTDVYQGACKKREWSLKENKYSKVAGAAYMGSKGHGQTWSCKLAKCLVESDWGATV